MTSPSDPRPDLHSSPPDASQPGRGHGWLMMWCCVPMLVIAIVLVALGVVSGGFVITAVACMAMMALMMRAMDHGGSDG